MKSIDKLKERAKEIEITIKNHSHEIDEKEYLILMRELNNLDIKIRAEESIYSGEWKQKQKYLRGE